MHFKMIIFIHTEFYALPLIEFYHLIEIKASTAKLVGYSPSMLYSVRNHQCLAYSHSYKVQHSVSPHKNQKSNDGELLIWLRCKILL